MKHFGKNKRWKKALSIAMSCTLLLSSAVPGISAIATEDDDLVWVSENVAKNKKVTIYGNTNADRPAEMATDGVIDTIHNYAEIGSEQQQNPDDPYYIQVDLGGQYELEKLKLYRYWDDGRKHKDTIIFLSQDETFEAEEIVYNSDADNFFGYGAGSDEEYVETSAGKEIVLDEIKTARYIRILNNGNDTAYGLGGHYVEIEAYEKAKQVSSTRVFENFDSSVQYLGDAWSQIEDENASKGSSHRNITDGTVNHIARANFTFTGTAVTVYGKVGTDFGSARFTLYNNVPIVTDVDPVSTYSETDEYGRPFIRFTGLENKEHTLAIVTDGLIDIDYFEVSTNDANTNEEVASIEMADMTMKQYDNLEVKYALRTADGSYVCKRADIAGTDDKLTVYNDDNPSTAKDNNKGKTGGDQSVAALKTGDSAFTIKYGELEKTVKVTVEALDVPVDEEGNRTYRRQVDHEHPLYLENYYWGDDFSGSSLTDLWEAVPDSIKPYTVILLIAERSISNRDVLLADGHARGDGIKSDNGGSPYTNEEYLSSREWIEENVKLANENQIPVAIQAVNGETGSRTIEIEWFDQLAEKYEYLQGLNGAEMYNAGMYGDEILFKTDYRNYMTQLTRVCVEHGMYLMWTDTNLNMVEDFLTNYAPIREIFRENKQNIIMQNKQSFSDPSSEALYKGLWLTDYVGNWGVASDWWNWQINGYQGHGTGGSYIDACYDMPEVRYAQDIMRVMSQGATCFKSEAQFYSNASKGMRMQAYQRAILPLLEQVTSGEIKIPTKEEVIERTEAIGVGKSNWISNYDENLSNVNPQGSKTGIIPFVPANCPQEELDELEAAGMTIFKDEKMTSSKLDELYENVAIEGDAYLENYGDGTWYWMNAADNKNWNRDDLIQSSKFAPNVNTDAEWISISAQPHAFAVLEEQADRISVHMSNYRYIKPGLAQYAPPDQTPCVFTYFYSHKLAKEMRDALLGFGDLNPTWDTDRLTTTFQVKTASKPELVFAPWDEFTNPVDRNLAEETQVEWDAETGIATIKILHNGPVNFEIVTGGDNNAASSITLDQSAVSIDRREVAKLNATVNSDAKNEYVVWESSNPEVATVNTLGVVAGVSGGTAVITATTADGAKATCTVTVATPVVTESKAENGSISVEGNTVTLKADEGYAVGGLLVNGKNVLENVEDATSELTVSVTLEQDSALEGLFVPQDAENLMLAACKAYTESFQEELYTGESWETLESALNALEDGAELSEINAVYEACDALAERIYYTPDDPMELPQAGEERDFEAEHTFLQDVKSPNFIRIFYADSEDGKSHKTVTASNGQYLGFFRDGNKITLYYDAPEAGVYQFTPVFRGSGTYSWSGENVVAGSAAVSGSETEWSSQTFEIEITKAGAGALVISADGAAAPETDKFVVTREKAAVDKAALQEVIATAEGLDESRYTPESYADLKAALEAGKAVLAQEDATQEEVNQAAEAIQNAMDALVKVDLANKTLLKSTVEYALTLDTEGVAASAKAYFEKMLAEAQAILSNPDATQEEVDAAWNNLLEGIWGLGITEGDKKMLNQLIAKADWMMENKGKYVETYWEELEIALEKAKKVSANGDALQDEVDAASDALHEAIMKQRYQANKENLEELIKEVSGTDLSVYTEASAEMFRAALQAAESVLADESLTEDDQAVVDDAEVKLLSAYEALEEKTDSQPSDTSKPENPSDPDSGKDEGGSDKETPATGNDLMPIWSVAAVLAAAAMALIVLKKKQYTSR